MTKKELLFALMALPDDAEIYVQQEDGETFGSCKQVQYFDRTEDNTIWLS